MKQFNLDEYLANPNQKVVTRGGNKVRIVCTDMQDDVFSVAGVVTLTNGHETCQSFTKDGYFHGSHIENTFDLFFASTKKEGWVNMYRAVDGSLHFSIRTYPTKEEALEVALATRDENYVSTIKIKWEE